MTHLKSLDALYSEISSLKAKQATPVKKSAPAVVHDLDLSEEDETRTISLFTFFST